MILVGTLPIVAGGLILKPLIESSFRSLYVNCRHADRVVC